MQQLMSEASYYSSRAQSYAQLARETKDLKLKEALEAVSHHFARSRLTRIVKSLSLMV
jgi:hypothetical protein